MTLVTQQDVCRFYRRDFWGGLKSYFSYGFRLTKFIYRKKRRRRPRSRRLRRRSRRLRRRLRRRRRRYSRYRRRRRRIRIYSNRFELLKLDNRRFVRKKKLPKNAFRLHNKEKLRLYFLNFSEYAFRYYLVTLLKSRKNLTKLTNVFAHFGARLDHLLFLAGFAPTLFHSREFLSRGCIMINNKVVTSFRFVPARGTIIRLNPWRLAFWKKFRRARIRILYKNFLGRLSIRSVARRHFYKTFYKRFYISRKIFLRRRRIKHLRFPRNLIYTSRRHYRKVFFTRRRLRLRLIFLISVCLRQTTSSLKRLSVLGVLLNNCITDENRFEIDIKSFYYLYYNRLVVTSMLMRVYIKLLRRLARRFKIRTRKQLPLQFLKAIFFKGNRKSAWIRRTLTFDPWFDMGVVALPNSRRFLYFWRLYERQAEFVPKLNRFRAGAYRRYYDKEHQRLHRKTYRFLLRNKKRYRKKSKRKFVARRLRRRVRSLIKTMHVLSSCRLPRRAYKKLRFTNFRFPQHKLLRLVFSGVEQSYAFILTKFLICRLGSGQEINNSAAAAFYYTLFPLFFRQQSKLLMRITGRLRFIIKRRYQSYRIFSMRGFKRLLRRPLYPQFVKEYTTKSIAYIGIPAKLRKKIAKFFYFPCRLNLRTAAFFYFNRKLQRAAKEDEVTYVHRF